MSNVNGITSVGPGLEGVRLAAEIQAATLSLVRDTISFEGQAALQLIASATVDPAVGQNINVQV